MRRSKRKHRTSKEQHRTPTEVLQGKVQKTRKKRSIGCLIAEILGTIIATYLVVGVVFGIAVINGNSMEPNYREGDIAIFLRIGSRYQKGDVVLLHNTATKDYIKRVVAVEGDQVSIDDGTGTLLLNGKEVEEDFIYTPTNSRPGGVELPITVGKNSVFLLGDNREVSKDSRQFGVVQNRQIEGKVLFILSAGR